MSPQRRRPDADTSDVCDEPTAWFVELEIARKRGDVERATHALRQLHRLGVSVEYATPAAPGATSGVRS
jgi:hypothetical protein